MIHFLFNLLLCIFIMTACAYSIISEKKRNKQMDEIFNRLRKRYKELDKENE